jgi:hypothetical protein
MALQNMGWYTWVKPEAEWQPVTLVRTTKGYPWIKKTGMLNGKPQPLEAGLQGHLVNDVGLLGFEVDGVMLYSWRKHLGDTVVGHVALENEAA